MYSLIPLKAASFITRVGFFLRTQKDMKLDWQTVSWQEVSFDRAWFRKIVTTQGNKLLRNGTTQQDECHGDIAPVVTILVALGEQRQGSYGKEGKE
jgi:hypothetical protein